jgi:NAD(P)-dependent dehydrogenase (short-subunit alcohol dehydrogenase family)
MADLIITGASEGIGRALALALAPQPQPQRLILVARNRERLEALAAAIAAAGGAAVAVPADLSSLAGARALGEKLLELVAPHATLVHNAGVWPTARVLTSDGLETAFVVNHLAPLALQQPLLAAQRLDRILVVSAGLIVKGRFDRERTPTGADFSSLRTYCTTKLCFALAMRDIAAAHPELDVVALHPGVVRTGLGARSGPLGWLLALVKRSWETPEQCGARLARILARPRWSTPGQAQWLIEEREQPWPPIAEDEPTRRAVRESTAALLASGLAG